MKARKSVESRRIHEPDGTIYTVAVPADDQPADPRHWIQRHESLYSAMAIGGLVLAGFLTWHWGNCLFARTEIHAVEGTTRELYFVQRHWFGKTEQFKLEARRDENGDWHWMFKSDKDGNWHPFFRFE